MGERSIGGRTICAGTETFISLDLCLLHLLAPGSDSFLNPRLPSNWLFLDLPNRCSVDPRRPDMIHEGTLYANHSVPLLCVIQEQSSFHSPYPRCHLYCFSDTSRRSITPILSGTASSPTVSTILSPSSLSTILTGSANLERDLTPMDLLLRVVAGGL
jgi:hypothetical protein